MKYKFPVVNDISEVRTALHGRTDFIEVQKEDYIVFNYVIATPDTFPKVEGWKNAMLRECRGLIFNLEGKCIRRPFHKFFNLGEREETMPENVYISSDNSMIMEKLDGSMIAPFYTNGKIRWGTKMGVTDLTNQVEEFVSRRSEYHELAEHCINLNVTPIFEWCSNKNRIVLPYEYDNLVLTAIRMNDIGEYISYKILRETGLNCGIPVVDCLHTWSEQSVREAKGQEGVVVRFDDGHMLKIKSDWYVDLHKTKEAIQTERFVIKMIFSEQVDDILPKLQSEDAEKLKQYQKDVAEQFRNYCGKALDIADWIGKEKIDRKTFALEHAKNYSSDLRSFLFRTFDENFDCDAMKYFGELIIKKTGCNKNLKEVEHIYGYRKWDYHNPGDAV